MQIQLPDNMVSNILEKMIFQLNELNATYYNQYNNMNGNIDMHLFTSFLTTIYSYFMKYPSLTFFVLKKKEFFETFIQLTECVNYFTFFSTHQSKVFFLIF